MPTRVNWITKSSRYASSEESERVPRSSANGSEEDKEANNFSSHEPMYRTSKFAERSGRSRCTSKNTSGYSQKSVNRLYVDAEQEEFASRHGPLWGI